MICTRYISFIVHQPGSKLYKQQPLVHRYGQVLQRPPPSSCIRKNSILHGQAQKPEMDIYFKNVSKPGATSMSPVSHHTPAFMVVPACSKSRASKRAPGPEALSTAVHLAAAAASLANFFMIVVV